ncbi:MAG: deoxyribodipyrimidine photo-lyase [Alphaproteobacteria bacterium]|nr:deoxyribodipyrimidine photo-lyase [Alphaproteobacteria bacterium]
MHVVWFKRDLRVQDNGALSQAAARGDVLPLYVVESELWCEADMSGRQWAFVAEALEGLKADLQACGQPLLVRTGEMIDVLKELLQTTGISALWSHEETGNGWTFLRDKKVAAWCRANGIPWHELRNNGVQRRLPSRDGWAANWDRFMSEPLSPAPSLKPLAIDLGRIPSASDLGLSPDTCPLRQTGGRRAGLERMNSFLSMRGASYRSAMSSPVAGENACSRLSPHLAWGTLSMREVAQATWARQRAMKANPAIATPNWRGSLKSFNGRLHWHCHFIQKLEDEPRIEFENLHSKYDGIRPSAPDQDRLRAWANGETGLPFMDACMRYLRATGWLNFRMRSMLMATASYHLWLDWRAPGQQLARYFTDYEPGIHWSQVQMQSGTTGINTVRIYNPVKQGFDQDPTGAFTRKWVPELDKISDKYLQEPWKAENARVVLGKAYPIRIVDHIAAAREARDRIWAVRRGADFNAEASAVAAKHGSRKSGIPHRGQRAKKKESAQLTLRLGDPS